VVNLDGAFGEAADANLAALGKILEVGAKVQFGGGLRALDAIEHVLDLGVSRVVLGTVAVTHPEMVDAALAMFTPERVAIGVDARAGIVQVKGWREGSVYTTAQLGERLQMQGVRRVIFTDIARDGVGSGLNLAETVMFTEQTGFHVIASGGVRTAADVLAARDAGLAGAIVGRALYEGMIELAGLLAKIVK
jgi:phosphoribosylformimino-5-aminoimidazole carboxamide ribotide isomerase